MRSDTQESIYLGGPSSNAQATTPRKHRPSSNLPSSRQTYLSIAGLGCAFFSLTTLYLSTCTRSHHKPKRNFRPASSFQGPSPSIVDFLSCPFCVLRPWPATCQPIPPASITATTPPIPVSFSKSRLLWLTRPQPNRPPVPYVEHLSCLFLFLVTPSFGPRCPPPTRVGFLLQ